MATSSSTSTTSHLRNHQPYGSATSAPPPTPSTQTQPTTASSNTADTLSRLLHRLPPNLSLPTRLSPSATLSTTTTPTPTSPLPTNPSELGYFQLTTHSITPQLAHSAELQSLSLSNLPNDQRINLFPNEWPFGFDLEDEDDDKTTSFSLCMDGACSTTAEGAWLEMGSLREMGRELEKVGLEVVASAVGLKKEEVGPMMSRMMWISEGDKEGRVYPYVVGLQYQIRPQKWRLMSDSGAVVVEPKVGSLLVTIGDIAQVWSNGKLKKVRGRPVAILEDKSKFHCISMSLLLTLPLEATVSPLFTIPTKINDKVEACVMPSDDNGQAKLCDIDDEKIEVHANDDDGSELEIDGKDERVFNLFSFEDYAWRVYHERIPLKDPLVRYRIVD